MILLPLYAVAIYLTPQHTTQQHGSLVPPIRPMVLQWGAFVRPDRDEEMLFIRFLNMKGIFAAVTTGSFENITFGKDSFTPCKEHSKPMYLLYKREFGIDLNNRTPDSMVIKPFHVFKIEWKPSLDAKSATHQFLQGSLQMRALKECELFLRGKKDVRLNGMSYQLRPWITSKLKRTEAVEGNLSADVNGRAEKVKFLCAFGCTDHAWTTRFEPSEYSDAEETNGGSNLR